MKIIRIDDLANFDNSIVDELLEKSGGQPCAFGLFSEVFLNALPGLGSIFDKLGPGYKLILDRSHYSITPANWTVPTLYIDWHLLRVKNAVDRGAVPLDIIHIFHSDDYGASYLNRRQNSSLSPLCCIIFKGLQVNELLLQGERHIIEFIR